MEVYKKSKEKTLTIIGLVIMLLITLTKIIPSTSIAGYSVFVGIVFFFVVESVGKSADVKSGLEFKTFFSDIKKRGVILLILLLILSAILTLVVGDLIFKGAFSEHVMGRTDSMLSFDKIPLLIFQVVIAAFGEEIAWRGFFLGKSMKFYPFWICALVSSMLFAFGHMATGKFALVFYDIFTVFIDSVLYSIIYRKTNNCFISTVAHIICNATGIVMFLIFV